MGYFGLFKSYSDFNIYFISKDQSATIRVLQMHFVKMYIFLEQNQLGGPGPVGSILLKTRALITVCDQCQCGKHDNCV